MLTSSGDLDIYVLKLDSNGDFVWAVAAGDQSPGDTGYALAVDDIGDVYVTGRFYGSFDFDPGPATYALSSVGGADAFVWKLTTDGDFVWARSVGGNHPGSYNFDVGNGIAVDDSHNVYISGQFWNTGDFDPGPDVLMLPHAGPPSEVKSSDAFLVKLDAGGNLAWARGFGGYNGNDMALDVVVNPVGDVYATGFFSNTVDFDPGPRKYELTSLGKEDIFFLRLDAAGNFVAARAIGGAGSDTSGDLAMDCTGSVYLAGRMSESVEFDPGSDSFDLTSVGDGDIFVARLDPYGKTLWARNMGGAAADYGTGVAVDSAGNVYVAGEFRGDADFDPESDGGDLTSVGDLDAFLSKVTQPAPCTPVTVRVEDGRGGFDTQSFVVMDVRGNGPPQIVSAPTANAFLGSTYVHDVDAVDPDYDALSYSLAAAPGGMSIDESNGMITWPAASVWLEQTVAHYRFEEGPHLSPVTTIVDSGPNALHGEVVGNLKYTLNISDYPHSGSYALDATPDLDFGRVLDDPLLHLDGSFRLEALVRPKYSGSPDGAAAGIDTIVAKQAYAGGGSFLDAYGIYFDPDTGKFSTAIGFGSGSGISSQATGEKIESENSFSNGQWHHVAASYVLHGSDATLSLYVDVGLEASETFPAESLFFGNGPLHIGAGNYADDPNGTGLYRRNFRGEIDEIHISTLSIAPGPADVTVRVEDGRGGFDTQSFLLAIRDEVNQPPEIITDPVRYAALNEPYQYEVHAIDPNDDVLTYTLPQGPDGMVIRESDGLIEWQPPPDALTSGEVSFFDGDFVEEDWDFEYFIAGDPRTEALAETREADGNPGAYRYREWTAYMSPHISGAVTAVQIQNTFSYDPAVNGAIHDLDFAFDVKTLAVWSADSSPALIQDGKYYIALEKRTFTNDQWVNVAFDDLRESDFFLLDPSNRSLRDETRHPDFSSTGAPVQFGYYNHARFVFGSGRSGPYYSSLDNWSCTVTPIPTWDVAVLVADGRGESDSQEFTLSISPLAEIQGFVFKDANEDYAWNRLGDLLVHRGEDPLLVYDLQSGAFVSPLVLQESANGVTGMSYGPDGDIFAPAWDLDRIYRFDGQTGELVGTFISPDNGGQLVQPSSITFGPDGQAYVTSQGTHSIQKYDGNTGEFLGTFATSQLNMPYELEFGPDGNLYVAEYYGGVLRFDGANGTFLEQVAGGQGTISFAFGPNGHIYVPYRGGLNSAISEYVATSGQLVSLFVDPGSGGLNDPYDIEFGVDGHLYAANTGDGRVLKYDGQTGAFLGELESSAELRTVSALLAQPGDPEVTPELGLVNWTVYLDSNANGQRDVGEKFIVTDQHGRYIFDNLAPGHYVVSVEPQFGWKTTSPQPIFAIDLLPDQPSYGNDFGVLPENGTNENHPPVFMSAPPAVSTVGQVLQYAAEATDADGDPLRYDLIIAPQGMVVDSEGLVIWRPSASQVGAHDVILRVQDDRGGSALQPFRIDVLQPNSMPIITSTPTGPAVADLPWQYTVKAYDPDGDPITFSLDGPDGMQIDETSGVVAWTPTGAQANQSHHVAITASDGAASTMQLFDLPVQVDAPNNAPQITSTPRQTAAIDQLYLYQVDASDQNSDPLQYRLELIPAGMTVDQQGLVTWTPQPDQLGSNSVRLIVEDGRGGFAAQEFTILVTTQIANHAPRIVSNPPLAAILGREYRYDVHVVDPDGDPLVWSLGTKPAGMSIDPQRGSIRWIPDATHLGTQVVEVQVTDTLGASATQTYTLTVRSVNLPPAITSVPPTLAYIDATYRYAVRATDVEGDSLVFSLTAWPSGMTVDPQSGFIEWAPNASQLGSHNVAILVTDGQGGTATQTYTIVVGDGGDNEPPVITSSPGFSATAEQPYWYVVTAQDPDGDPIEFLLLEKPEGMAINTTSGLIQWTPTVAQLGTHPVTVAAVDPLGQGGTQTYTVTVLNGNQPPTITSTPNQVVYASQPYRYDVRAHDPDGDPITYTLDARPAGMQIDALGRVTWSPQINDVGTHRVEITVADNRDLWVTQSYDSGRSGRSDETERRICSSARTRWRWDRM